MAPPHLVVPGLSRFDTTAATYDLPARRTLLDVDGASVVLWATAKETTRDVVLAPNVHVRYVVHASAFVWDLAADATHVYWLTSEGIFRRAK